MIVDFAIHDPHPPGHNPHAHVLLTMRAMDEHGKWLPKSRKVYDLDEYTAVQMGLLAGCFALTCGSIARQCGTRAAKRAAVFFCLLYTSRCV